MWCSTVEKIDPNPIVTNLTQAIQRDDYEAIEEITNKSREWCEGTNSNGYTALQEAMRQNKPIIFKNLLEYQDLVTLESVNAFGENAVEFAVNIANTNSDYYACTLIEKGVFIHGVAQSDKLSLLQRAIIKNSVRVVKLLLEKGVNVNVVNSSGFTLLDNLFRKERPWSSSAYELTAILLCFGADPFRQLKSVRGRIFNAFEMSVVHKSDACVQELLFYYTFDKQRSELHFNVFLEMLKMKSPLVSCLRDCNVEYIPEYQSYVAMVRFLFNLSIDELRLLLQEHETVICNVLDDLEAFQGEIISIDMYNLLSSNSILEHLEMLVENETLRPHMAYFFSVLDAQRLAISIRTQNKNEDVTNQLLIFYLLYGLRVDRKFVNRVYKDYGYGELFKLLLHLDIKDGPLSSENKIIVVGIYDAANFERYFSERTTNDKNNVVVAAICERNFSLERFFEDPEEYDKSNVESLMDYFASPKFSHFFELHKDNWAISDEGLRRAKNHPNVPLLQEMTRNAVRRDLVQRFNVKSTKEFYTLINGLPIDLRCKKIITFETKLYHD